MEHQHIGGIRLSAVLVVSTLLVVLLVFHHIAFIEAHHTHTHACTVRTQYVVSPTRFNFSLSKWDNEKLGLVGQSNTLEHRTL